MTSADRTSWLDAEALRSELGDQQIGNRIVVVQEVTSTNDHVWALVQQGAGTGLVAFAEKQTAGRGQRGNRWESTPGKGLWFSILLRPGIKPGESARLTSWATQIVAVTIREELQVVATIKEPNDVLIDGRKIAGVLAEMRVETDGSYAAIVGIGVNVNQRPEDFSEAVRSRATSLAIACDQPINRHTLAISLLRNLDRTYRERFSL